MKKTAIFLLILLIAMSSPFFNEAQGSGYGEDSPALGQFTDDFINETFITVKYKVERNATLNAMELNYTSAAEVYEDFTKYTETDPNNRLTQTNTLSIFTGLKRGDGNTYLKEDYGVGYFDLDFTYTWVFNITQAEAGDADSRTWLRLWAVVVAGIPTDAGARIMLNLDQVGASDILFTLELYIRNGVGGADSDLSINLDVGTEYFCKIVRDNGGDDITFTIRTGSDSGPLIDTLFASFVNYNDVFRYVFSPMRKDSGTDPNDWISGYIEFLWNQSEFSAYVNDGYFLTDDYLNYTTGNSLTLLTNTSIPEDTSITVQFSTNNSTWTLNDWDPMVGGFEAIDLRILNYSDIYLMYNLSGPGGEVTPRLYQSRLVTTNGTGGAPGDGVTVIESDTPWIALAIILSIIALLLAWGSKR